METYYPAVMVALRGGYGVSFPDLPGCTAAGATQDEAAEAAADVLLGRLEVMAVRGEAPPPPSPIEQAPPEPGEVGRLLVKAGPFALQRINVSVDGLLLAQVDRAARRLGMTRSSFLAEGARRLVEAEAHSGAALVSAEQAAGAQAFLEQTAAARGISVETLLAEARAYGAQVTGKR